MSLYDDITHSQTEGGLDGIWSGTVATNAAGMTSTVEVLIGAFDAKHRFGPCRWMARDATALPERGDSCLVVFDEKQRPFVIAWWPYGW